MPATALLCEIHAHRSALAAALAEIAVVCARDVGLPIIVKTLSLHGVNKSVLTLHLPVELASTQHRVWCLACRLACFCPQSRVSVLVQGATAFAETHPRARRHSA